jgi:hypothetical protein
MGVKDEYHHGDMTSSSSSSSSFPVRPVFLGNLIPGFEPNAAVAIFERPIQPPKRLEGMMYDPMPVDRVDLKRGYCFIFLKDAPTIHAKEQTEAFVALLNGMYVSLSKSRIIDRSIDRFPIRHLRSIDLFLLSSVI